MTNKLKFKEPSRRSLYIPMFGGGGLTGADRRIKGKSKDYPMVSSNDFAGPDRSYPIPTKADAIDALRLAGLHGASGVKAKVYAKYPELRKEYGGEVDENNLYPMIFGQGGNISPGKARLILHEGIVKGHPITEKQRKFFGAMSNMENGGMVNSLYKPIFGNNRLINVEQDELEVNPNTLQIEQDFKNKPKHPQNKNMMNVNGNTLANKANIIIPANLREQYLNGTEDEKKRIINLLKNK